jgi:hydroxymethylbilane synthase
MTSRKTPFRLGTRASPLALAQAKMVRDALIAAHGWAEADVVLRPVVASGDRVLDRALADVGGKALWTKELDQWLAAGEIDASVHSMKDVETLRPPEFTIGAMLPRADVRDRLVGAASIDAIPQGGRFGTSAPRRRAQMLRLRPDLDIILFRGNVQTRLAKIETGEAAATLLAAAGVPLASKSAAMMAMHRQSSRPSVMRRHASACSPNALCLPDYQAIAGHPLPHWPRCLAIRLR